MVRFHRLAWPEKENLDTLSCHHFLQLGKGQKECPSLPALLCHLVRLLGAKVLACLGGGTSCPLLCFLTQLSDLIASDLFLEVWSIWCCKWMRKYGLDYGVYDLFVQQDFSENLSCTRSCLPRFWGFQGGQVTLCWEGVQCLMEEIEHQCHGGRDPGQYGRQRKATISVWRASWRKQILRFKDI